MQRKQKCAHKNFKEDISSESSRCEKNKLKDNEDTSSQTSHKKSTRKKHVGKVTDDSDSS